MSKPSLARGSADVDFAVFCGIDVAREIHHAVALDQYGHRLVDRPLPNAEPDLLALFQDLEAHGRVLIVVDQLASIGALAIAVARARGITVAYLPGLAMRRIGRTRRQPPVVQSVTGGCALQPTSLPVLSYGSSMRDLRP